MHNPFEFCELKDECKNLPAQLYQQAQGFYDLFKPFLTDGYQLVPELPGNYYYWKNLLSYMVNFHFYVELMLKAIIATKRKLLRGVKGDGHHNLERLLKNVSMDTNEDEDIVLRELSKYCIDMRYREGSLQTRYNPPQKLLDILESIFTKLEDAYKQAIESMSAREVSL